jgi:lysophospholipase L1-like esterase
VLWCAVLQVDVISRGHSGYNSRWGLKVFEQVVKQLAGREVVLLTIWLGANDAAIPGRSA